MRRQASLGEAKKQRFDAYVCFSIWGIYSALTMTTEAF